MGLIRVEETMYWDRECELYWRSAALQWCSETLQCIASA